MQTTSREIIPRFLLTRLSDGKIFRFKRRRDITTLADNMPFQQLADFVGRLNDFYDCNLFVLEIDDTTGRVYLVME